MQTEGYIKLHRSMLEWEWFKNKNVRLVFEYLLLAANYKDKIWRGRTIKRGQIFTSYATLAEYNDISIQQARTAISNIKSTGEITVLATGGGLLINVNNYEKYQGGEPVANRADNMEERSEITGNQQANTQPDNTNIRNKEDNNIRTDDIDKNNISARAREEEAFKKASQYFLENYCNDGKSDFRYDYWKGFTRLRGDYGDGVLLQALRRMAGQKVQNNPLGYLEKTCEQITQEIPKKAGGG